MNRLLELTSFKDERGSLTVIEKILPFPIKRVYYIYDTNHLPRAGHGQRVGDQALICLKGLCKIDIRSLGKNEAYVLNSPDQCLLLGPNEWHSIEFQSGSILLVLASTFYNRDEYFYD